MALFIYSLVVVWFHQTGHELLRFPFRPWYTKKEEPSFADMLTTLRRVSYEQKTPQPLPKQSGRNLDRPTHRASQPHRVSGTLAGDPGIQHHFTINSPGGISPTGPLAYAGMRNLNRMAWRIRGMFSVGTATLIPAQESIELIAL